MGSREETKDTTEVADIIIKFNNLSDEDKKKVFKRLIWQNAIHSYVDHEAAARNEPGSKEFDDFRLNVINKSKESVDLLLDTMYTEEEKLKDEIIKTFVEKYSSVVAKTKKKICGAEHKFTEWEETYGERTQYDLDGDFEYTSHGNYFERVCEYCGTRQVAYSENEKQIIEQRTQEEIKFSNFCKKLTKKISNKPNKEN